MQQEAQILQVLFRFVRIKKKKKKKEFDDRITKTQNQRAASEHTHISACSAMLCETKQAPKLQHTFENEVFSVQADKHANV